MEQSINSIRRYLGKRRKKECERTVSPMKHGARINGKPPDQENEE